MQRERETSGRLGPVGRGDGGCRGMGTYVNLWVWMRNECREAGALDAVGLACRACRRRNSRRGERRD